MAINTYELLYMSHQGDDRAFEALLKQCGDLICSIASSCMSVFQIQHEREDMIQEGQAAMVKAVDCFRDDQNVLFQTFLAVVARRRICNVLKKLTRRNIAMRDSVSLDATVAEGDSMYCLIPQKSPLYDPVYAMHYHNAQERLMNTLKTMNIEDRKIAYSWMSGDSYAYAAERQGLSVKSYESRRRRVIRKIKKAVSNSV